MKDFKNDDEVPKSKSQIKREMIELQELGECLIALNSEQLNHLKLPPELRHAIDEAKKITSHGARRRQMQYIGRLMRDVDDPSLIKEFLESLKMKDQKAAAYHHMLESWREKLLANDSAITEFINLYAKVDRQYLRQLVVNAKKERASGRPVGACKLLFRYLRELEINKDKDEDGR